MFVTGLQKTVVWVPSYPGERPPRPVDPDWGVEGPADPGWGVPEGGRPDQGLPGWAWPERPGHGLPWPGYPGRPGHGLPWPERETDPGWGVDEGAEVGGGPVYPGGLPGQLPVFPGFPGFPGRPGHGLPRPPRERGPWPIVPPDDTGGHPQDPALPDLNRGRWATITKGRKPIGWPAFIVDPHRGPIEADDDYEPRHPAGDLQPGEWVTVLYYGEIAWAWVPDLPAPEVEPE